MAVEFDEVDDLKRERDIEGVEGVLLRVTEGVYLDALCQSDANPAFRQFGPSRHREVQRKRNAGATPEELDVAWAHFYFDTRVIKGWRGVTSKGVEVPFTRENWIAWVKMHARVLLLVETHTTETMNFRSRRIEKAADQLGN